MRKSPQAQRIVPAPVHAEGGAQRVGLVPAALRFMTAERMRRYPQIVAAICVSVLLYDRATGKGLVGGLDLLLGGDFISFYTAGNAVARGHAEWLSSPADQLAQQALLVGHAFQSLSLWLSPPYFAWFFAPFTALSYSVAFALFTLLGALLLVGSLHCLSRELGALSTFALSTAAIQFFPTIEWFSDGQTTGLWLLLYAIVFVALRRGRESMAGLALGLFACKPQLALGLAVALLAARRWKVLLVAATASGALVSIGLVTLPSEMSRYVARGSAVLAFIRSPAYLSHGLVGALEVPVLLLGGISRLVGDAVGFALTLGLLLVVFRAWARPSVWQPGSVEWDLRMAATFALGVIASPHVYNYDLALLVVPLFIAACRLPRHPDRSRPLDGGPILVTTAAVWALSLVGPLLTKLEQEITKRYLGFPVALQLGFFAVALWGWLVLRSFDEARSPATQRISYEL
jgi:hypothetical protein